MHLGILGVGRIGQMHARHALDCDRVTAVTLCDTDGVRVAELAAELGVRGSTDRDAVLRDVDAVLVATPTATHGEAVGAALGAGVHVLCEKPLALDPHVIADLASRAADGVHLVVGFQRRFDPAHVALRAAIRAGEYGRVYVVRATMFDHTPPDLAYVATSGGIFHDQFVHDLDTLPWLLGERVVAVQASGGVLVDPGFADADDVDTAAVLLRFASGVLGVAVGGRRNGGGYDNRVEVFAERASVSTGLDQRMPLTSVEPGGVAPHHPHEHFITRWARAYRRELEVFADVVAGRVENPSPALDGVHALEIAHACDVARRTGVTVTIGDDGAARYGEAARVEQARRERAAHETPDPAASAVATAPAVPPAREPAPPAASAADRGDRP